VLRAWLHSGEWWSCVPTTADTRYQECSDVLASRATTLILVDRNTSQHPTQSAVGKPGHPA
jgi:hypothetical protein